MGVKERWAAAGLSEVTLPSGFRVRMAALTPVDLVIRGIFPKNLLGAIAAMESEEEALEDPSVAAELYKAMRVAIADSIRDLYDEDRDAWERVTVTADELDSGTFDPRDVETLMQLVTSRVTPREVNAAAELLAGTADLAGVERVKREEAGATVTGLATFRDDGGGDAPRPDGQDVPAAALGDAQPRRSRRRAGSGPGASPAPGAG